MRLEILVRKILPHQNFFCDLYKKDSFSKPYCEEQISVSMLLNIQKLVNFCILLEMANMEEIPKVPDLYILILTGISFIQKKEKGSFCRRYYVYSGRRTHRKSEFGRTYFL